MLTARLKASGGWIDVSFDGETILMAAVGPPLNFLVKEPATLSQRQKRTEERGRYRRMAMDALRSAGAPGSIDDASVAWSFRAG
jgi:hypothetical protein